VTTLSAEKPTLQAAAALQRSFAMRRIFTLLPLLLLTGCTGTLTNLTPGYQPRNANGLYPVSVALHTRQQSLRWESIKPYVMIGDQAYLMRPTPLLSNRWETLIPVPADSRVLNYRYKVDWQYNAIPDPLNDSMTSKKQVLKIVDK
jgi:hypothetical protein